MILLRSAFELRLNLEEILRGTDEADRQKRAYRFLWFDGLQQYLAWRSEYDYRVHTGRLPRNEKLLSQLDSDAQGHFGTFVQHVKNGKIKWATSWCGRNVFELAEASKHPLSVWHYRTLYAYCSQFVHASPLAVMSTHRVISQGSTFEQFIAAQMEKDEQHLLLAVSLLLLTTFEILQIVGDILPKFDPGALLPIMKKWYQLNGEKPPTDRH